ncbi:MAG: hypothetical protein K9G60_05380, partial [Pseudolabrys sp.]|nr:hypothetical protein [Pseudolabrys sp.]
MFDDERSRSHSARLYLCTAPKKSRDNRRQTPLTATHVSAVRRPMAKQRMTLETNRRIRLEQQGLL